MSYWATKKEGNVTKIWAAKECFLLWAAKELCGKRVFYIVGGKSAGQQKSWAAKECLLLWAAKELGGKSAGRQKSVLYCGRQKSVYKGLESDPSNSPPAQEHFTTILNFH